MIVLADEKQTQPNDEEVSLNASHADTAKKPCLDILLSSESYSWPSTPLSIEVMVVPMLL
jgi:hypothetical protein